MVGLTVIREDSLPYEFDKIAAAVYEKLGQMDENEAQKYLEMMMPMK